MFFFWLQPIPQHRSDEDNLKFKGQIAGGPDRPDKIRIILWHNGLLALAYLASIKIYHLVKDKHALWSINGGFEWILCGFRQRLPNISTLRAYKLSMSAKRRANEFSITAANKSIVCVSVWVAVPVSRSICPRKMASGNHNLCICFYNCNTIFGAETDALKRKNYLALHANFFIVILRGHCQNNPPCPTAEY